MNGKVVLVTGAASGIGLAAAQDFARLGARLLVVARSPERAQEAATKVADAVPGAEVDGLVCDVSNLSELRRFASSLVARESRLDVVVNNAGVMPAERQRSADGHELTFATHVLAPFALTEWTRGLLVRSAPARVINVSSGGMYTASIPCDDLESDRAVYSPKRMYATTKREQVVISETEDARLRERGVRVYAMHPGWVDTPGVAGALPVFRQATRPIIRRPQEGADTIVWLGASTDPLSGPSGFWHDRRARPSRYRLGAGAEPEDCREKLWAYCESIISQVPEPATAQG